MGQFDNLSKFIFEARPADILHWLAPELKVKRARSVSSEINPPPRLADKVLAYELSGPTKTLSLHIEVQANWKPDLPRRMFRYYSGLSTGHSSLESLLLILRPGGGAPQDYFLAQSPLGKSTRHDFWLRCLWEHSVEEFLESGLPGLIPFIPFAKGASPERIEEGMEALKSAPPLAQGGLKSVLVVLGSQVFSSWDWRRVIKKEGLMGLRLIDELLADQKDDLLRQGRLEGEKKGEITERIRLLTELIQARLGKNSGLFVDALAKLKPKQHDQIANLLVTVRGKKTLIQKLQELIAADS